MYNSFEMHLIATLAYRPYRTMRVTSSRTLTSAFACAHSFIPRASPVTSPTCSRRPGIVAFGVGVRMASGSGPSAGASADDPAAQFRAFMSSRKTLTLATVAEDGRPHASTAPFVRDTERNFYVFVSGLSEHTAHLAAHRTAGVLLASDESETPQPFARTRATFDCTADQLPRGTSDWDAVADEFAASFGDIVGVLRGLGDFAIFRLTPTKGRFVVGFAKAYDVAQDWQTLTHVRPNAEK